MPMKFEGRPFGNPLNLAAYFLMTRTYGPLLYFTGFVLLSVLALRVSAWLWVAAAVFGILFVFAFIMGGVILGRYPRPGQSAFQFALGNAYAHLGRNPIILAFVAIAGIFAYLTFASWWWAIGWFLIAGFLWITILGAATNDARVFLYNPAYAHYGFQKNPPDPGL